jgi:hypothetical protein
LATLANPAATALNFVDEFAKMSWLDIFTNFAAQCRAILLSGIGAKKPSKLLKFLHFESLARYTSVGLGALKLSARTRS